MDLEFDSYDLVVDDEKREYSPLPDGWYDARIMQADVRDTKSGNGGQYIAVRYDITGGEYAGRVVFGNVTIKNPNSQAEQIGRKQLSQIAMAGGMTSLPKNTDDFIGLDVKIKLAIRPATEQWSASNDVRDWKSQGGDGAVPKATKSNGNASAPWAK